MGKYLFKDFEAHCAGIRRATTITPNENPKVKADRIARAKKDYKYFFEYYFPHYAKAPTAEFHIRFANAVKKDETFKGILEAYRGAAKSVLTNIGLPLWLKAQDEMKCMLLISDNEAKACRLLAGIQAELKNNFRYINDFGEQMSRGNWEDGEFATKDGCGFFAMGLGQSPNGTRIGANRPDFVVVDDSDTKKRCKNPALVNEAFEWITDDLMGTFDIGKERFIFCNSRISKTSILATMHTKMVEEKAPADKWFYLKINAVYADTGEPTWPEKYTKAYWVKKKASVTLRSWMANYMNAPSEEGKVFKYSWIKWAEPLPLNEYDDLLVYIDPAWRTSSTSCYKAVRFWGKKGREFHLIDCWVRVESLADMVRYCYDLEESFPEDITVIFYIEGNFMQDDLVDEFEEYGDAKNHYIYITPDYRVKGDKFQRIEATSIFYQSGKIVYNSKKIKDPDFATGIQCLLAFEKGGSFPVDPLDADEGGIHILNKQDKVKKVNAVIGKREARTSW